MRKIVEKLIGLQIRPSHLEWRPWHDDRQSFIYLGLSGSIKTSFQQVEEKYFLQSLNTSIKKARK